MTIPGPDFWGDVGAEGALTPIMILRQQASLLAAKTNQLITAEVRTTTSSTYFTHHFNLVVPTLDGYNYELFKISHKIAVYPVIVGDDPVGRRLETEEEFKQWVFQRLSSPATKRVIANLLSMARA
jgi:hypothetical protein